MPNVTFAVPDELHREMKAHPEIKWSEVARKAIRREVERMHWYEHVLKDSRLSLDDAVKLGRDIRRAAAGRDD